MAKEISTGIKFLSFIAGGLLLLISLMFTVQLFVSMSPDNAMMQFIYGATGACIDIGKYLSCVAIIYFVGKEKFGNATISAVFFLICLMFSIIASQGLDLNEANVIKNKAILQSDEYKNTTNAISIHTNSKAENEAKLEVLQSSIEQKVKDSTISLEAELKSALSKNWLTTPQGSPRRGADVIRADISKKQAETRKALQAEIDSLAILTSTSEKLKEEARNNVKNITSTGKTTDGLIEFSNWLYNTKVGKFTNASSPDELLGWFYISKNFFCEFLSMFLLFIAGIENTIDTVTTNVTRRKWFNLDGIKDKLQSAFGKKKELVSLDLEDDTSDESDDSLEDDEIEVKKSTPIKQKKAKQIIEEDLDEEDDFDYSSAVKAQVDEYDNYIKSKSNQSPTPQPRRIGFINPSNDNELITPDLKVTNTESQVKLNDEIQKAIAQQVMIYENELDHIFTKEQLKMWMDSMYKLSPNNICPAYYHITNDSGLTKPVGDSIRKYLIAKGVLKCLGKGKPTLINKN